MSKNEFDCWCTEDPVCPHCGHVYKGWIDEGWEINGEVCTCDNCNKDFRVHAEYDVSYITEKIKENEQ